MLHDYFEAIKDAGIDAYIVADPGVIMSIREVMPDAEIHMSTQAGVVSHQSCMFWYNMGVKRAVLARELSLDDIKNIRSVFLAEGILATAKQSFGIPFLYRIGVSTLFGDKQNLPCLGRCGQAVFTDKQPFRNGKIIGNFFQRLPLLHLIILSKNRVQHTLLYAGVFSFRIVKTVRSIF